MVASEMLFITPRAISASKDRRSLSRNELFSTQIEQLLKKQQPEEDQQVSPRKSRVVLPVLRAGFQRKEESRQNAPKDRSRKQFATLPGWQL
jgi:hypothetical protein